MSNADKAYRWAAKIKQFATDKYPGLVAQVAGDFAGVIFGRTVRGTPIVSGRLVNGWTFSYFGAAVSEPGGVDRSGGINVIAREMAKITNLRSTQNIHISNAAPYAIPIEARYGMLANAVAQTLVEAKAIGARGAATWKAANP